jgi:hypothetical protein
MGTYKKDFLFFFFGHVYLPVYDRLFYNFLIEKARDFCLRRPGGAFLKNRPPGPPEKLLFRQKFLGGVGTLFSKRVLTRRRQN